MDMIREFSSILIQEKVKCHSEYGGFPVSGPAITLRPSYVYFSSLPILTVVVTAAAGKCLVCFVTKLLQCYKLTMRITRLHSD